MLLNRRTLSVGAVSLLFIFLSGQSAFAFSMPEMTMPTMSIPTPVAPNTTSIQTHIQISNTTSSNTFSSPTSTPTPTKAPSPTPTPSSTTSPVNSSTMPSLPSWFQSFSSLFNWVTPTPTSTPSQQSSATPTPTKTPTPTPTRTQPTPTPTLSTSSSLLDDKQQYMMDAINAYRAQNGLYEVQPSKETCDFAKVRAQEITTDFSHTGWEERVNNGTIPFSYSMITENIAMTSDYKNVVNLWINSPGHAANMRADTPYVCVGYSGNYYAYEGMRP